MLAEVWSWLTTPCAPQARRMGYLYEAIAMQARHQRHQAAWQSHAQASAAFIAQCFEAQPPGGVVLVLGSGLGVDLPREAMLAHFDEIWLVDLVHLRAARKRWGGSSKVRFITHDVTESLDSVLARQPQVATPERWLDESRIRLVVSANILGQLPLMPLSWLEARGLAVDDAQAHQLAQGWMAAHHAYLQAFAQRGARVCLVADMEWHYADGNQVREVVDAWRGLDHEAPQARWPWRVAPRGELGGNRTQTNWVGGWCWPGDPTRMAE